MIKPVHVLLTLLSIGALCALTMYFFPKDGITLNDELTLHFPNFNDFIAEDTTAVVFDVDSMLDRYEEAVDSTAIKDSIEKNRIQQLKKMLRLQYANGDERLPHFFQALYDLKNGKRSKVRILHYGDSQIEGDRITSFVREKLQAEFSGTGPGMLPLKEFIPNISITQTQSDNWLRFTIFGKKDTTVNHQAYGLRGILSRFTPYTQDTLWRLNEPTTAWIELKPSRLGYGHVKYYRTMRLHYGNSQSPTHMKVFVNDEMLFADTLPATQANALYTHTFEKTPASLRLEFTGKDSPDFYAISLESTVGVVMDNIAMRGSSGTIFTRISRSQLAYQFSQEPIALVLLQYGGNTVPYIQSKEKANQYGNWFAAQIRYIKTLLPEADIVLIGPSDMSIKQKTDYVTYPFLPEVRDALKAAAFKEGAAFWDIYEVMGGRNSMPSWVAAEPPLAGPDYIHFTPRGARRIAELFYNALQQDYVDFLQAKQAAHEAAEKQAIEDSINSLLDTTANAL
jgi:lysophospholipase L1-like esterase